MIHYLAIHDFVWINSTVTGKTLEFDYEALEECMAAQYSYGDSTHVLEQAAFMLEKILIRKPFAYGNMRTGLVSLLAFLMANKYTATGQDSGIADLIRSVAQNKLKSLEAVKKLAEPTQMGLRPGVTLRTIVTYLCNERREALRLLTPEDE